VAQVLERAALRVVAPVVQTSALLHRMSLWNWLVGRRPQVREFADTFMASRSQLNQSLVHWLPDASRCSVALLLSHDLKTFTQLQDCCEAARLDYHVLTGALSAAEICAVAQKQPEHHQASSPTTSVKKAPVILGLIEQLLQSPLPGRHDPHVRAIDRLAVLVAERHFFRQRDEVVYQFLKNFQLQYSEVNCEVGFFIALDDPLLRGKCDAILHSLLEHYGMRPDEPIQSHLLDRLVHRIQKSYQNKQNTSELVVTSER